MFKKPAQFFFLSLVALACGLFLFTPFSVLAAGEGQSCAIAACNAGLSCKADTKICVKDTFGVGQISDTVSLGKEDIRVTIAKILRTALGLLGVIALGIVLYGGFLWMTAGGDEEKVGTAKKILVNGVIGLAIILSAFSITMFVLSKLSEVTGSGVIPGDLQGGSSGCSDPGAFCPDDSGGGTNGCIQKNDLFVLLGITPFQENTGMNNIVIRAVFSKPIVNSADNVFVIEHDGQAVDSNLFAFSFVDLGDKRAVQAVSKSPAGVCDGNGTNCLAVSDKKYYVKIKSSVKDSGGNNLQNEEAKKVCGSGFGDILKNGASFLVDKKASDAVLPSVDVKILLEGQPLAGNAKLSAGGKYGLWSKVEDASGIGAAHLKIFKSSAQDIKLVDEFFAPAKESNKPFEFTHNFGIGEQAAIGDYTISVTGYDIDNNTTIKNINFSIIPSNCAENPNQDGCGNSAGSSCSDTSQCAAGLKCVNKVCAKNPQITNIDPIDGAAGNWITVFGKDFGEEKGNIEFGYDANKNSKIDDNEWKQAQIVNCQGKISWKNNYVIAEVPSDVDLPQASKSVIKLTAKDGKTDESNDSFGPVAGPFSANIVPTGLFTKNDVKRPGLCLVVNKDLATQAKPGEQVSALGSAFGDSAGSVLFGGLQFAAKYWADANITAVVPTNYNPGEISVKIKAKNDQVSNGVPFTVIAGGAEVAVPQIEVIDPKETTRRSYITIKGTGFGLSGKVYLNPEKGNDCSAGSCIEAIKTLPTFCGTTWSDKQIIVQIPNTIAVDKTYYVVVENGQTNLKSSGEESIFIKSGSALPSICLLNPAKGPSPLYEGDFLTLSGVFYANNPTVYFFKNTDKSTVDSLKGNKQIIDFSKFTITKYFNPKGVFAVQDAGKTLYLDQFAAVFINLSYNITSKTIVELDFKADGIGWEHGLGLDIPGYNGKKAIALAGSAKHETSLNDYLNYSTLGQWKHYKIELGKLYTGSANTIFFTSYCNNVWCPKVFNSYFRNVEIYEDLSSEIANKFWYTSDKYPNIIKSSNENEIKTALPVENGKSMPSGPIKILSNGQFSNSVYYEVVNCTNKDSKPPASAGYHCCNLEGTEDYGMWKKDEFACAGEVRDAGYVWRFTTGKFPDVPYVIEETTCPGAQNGQKELSSPSPWEKQTGGLSACVNSSVAVKFSTTMDAATLNSGNIILYECEGTDSYNCDGNKKKKVDWTVIGKAGDSAFIAEPSGLKQNTWYRVELSKNILSKGFVYIPGGKSITHSYPLKETSSCGNNTAYCFAFKTGAGSCAITGAGIAPPEYTTNLLGIVQSKSFPEDENIDNPAHPLLYLLWGSNDKSCAPIKIEGLGWNWSPKAGENKFLEVITTEKDTVSKAKALEHNADGVEFSAEIKKDEAKNILSDIKAVSKLFIDLLDPKVIYFEPNCTEACVNSQILAEFNRLMDVSTYSFWAVKIFKCGTDANNNICGNKTPFYNFDIDKNSSTQKKLVITLSKDLEPNTYYRVEITDSIKAFTGSKTIKGKSLEPMSWQFKTRADGAQCQASKLEIAPADFTASKIGQKTKYSATPVGSPDQCNIDGQKLNPWAYSYVWSSKDEKVAIITSVKQASVSDIPYFCSNACLKKGSDSFNSDKYLCGNGKVEPGEDCDIGAKDTNGNYIEVPEKSCTLNCLRPGNLQKGTDMASQVCGNGKVDTAVGEECDPGNKDGKTIATDLYCSDTCLNKGTTKADGTEKSNCGDGLVTKGEDCDITNPSGKVGCTSSCLHTGTKTEAFWCEQKNNSYYTVNKACSDTVSLCGNRKLEMNEECEVVQENNQSVLHIHGIPVGFNAEPKISIVNIANPQNYCSSNCRLQNLCGTNQFVEKTENDGMYGVFCLKGTPGCTLQCTLAGASPEYSSPSLCADGNVGTGESGFCELSSKPQSALVGPVQVATAIGAGKLDVNGKQQTTIEASIEKKANIKGSGVYSIECGFEEFASPKQVNGNKIFNNCPENTENLNGVSKLNSCCYARPRRLNEYPEDGSGLSGKPGVCRNTAVEIEFDKEIKADTVPENIFLIQGHGAGYTCNSAKGEQDITPSVQSALAYNITGGGWFKTIIDQFKKIFAFLIGSDTQATTFGVYLANTEKIQVWCRTSFASTPNVLNKLSAKGDKITTLITLPVDVLLEQDAVYGVLLNSGPSGMQDMAGVPIGNPDSKNTRDDIFVFKTGKEICKIGNVKINPSIVLFNTANQNKNLSAVATTKDDKKIVSTSAYQWDWTWNPQNNPVFDIPAKGFSSTTPDVTIASRGVQGKITAAATARVTKDSTAVESDVGKSFTAVADLIAMFCEQPWPPLAGGAWNPYKDDKFNFSFYYCADAGKTGVQEDNLPYFDLNKMQIFADINSVEGQKTNHCSVSGDACSKNSDCALVAPWPSSYKVNSAGDKFVGIESSLGVCFYKKVPALAEQKACSSSVDCSGDYPICAQGDGKGKICVSYIFPDKPIGVETKDQCPTSQYSGYEKSGGTQFFVISDIKIFQTCKAKAMEMSDALKKIIFFNDKNDNVIGLQIFKNEKRLSAAQWYDEKFPGAQNLQQVKISGYEGVSDGKNYYINALNIVKGSDGEAVVYNNIYLFSLNEGAQPGTQQVFQKLLENLEYNINLTNAGYCVDKGTPPATINFVEEIKSGIKYPTTNTACENDFDCVDPAGVPVAGTNGICSKSKDKFLRDWTRLWDVQSAQSKFTAKAPELKSGTFIPNYTLSRWPSWGSLGIGSDPLNTWTLCENSDLQTCWNTSESKFLCPAKMSVYEYEFVTSTAKYKLHVPFEYFKNDSLIKKIFGGEFITDPDSFTIEQSCKPNQKYSPLSGSCGDNTVQPNEQCDPPGTTFVNKSSSCNNPDGTTAVGSYVVSTCSNSCMFQNSCQKVAVCGNGIIEEGEKCDDGVLNDTYGHCAGEKNTKPCQIMYKEYCGNKFKEDNEYCDVNASNMPFVWTGNYALNKEQSCAYDCMSSGEYCGDGLLHSSEECDDGNSKSGDGCSYTCKKENNACINQQPQYYVYNTSDGNTKSVLFVTKLTQNMINSSIFPNSAISKSTKVYETEGPIDVCFANTNASEICQAAGLSCKHWTLWKLNPFSFQQSGCNIDFPPYEPGTAISVECSGVYIEKYIENIPIAQSGCGNAKMDSGEACDNGSNNGQKCVPGYNSTCSYCSSDCKKVLTVDSEKFCGNHTIDVIKKTPSTEDLKINMHVLAKWHNNNLYYPGIITSTANGLYGIEYYDGYSQLKTKQEELQIIEACDFDTDVLGNSITIRMDQKGEKVNYASADFSCTDKGKYVCAQDCTSYSAQCFSCIKADNKPVPKITLINPMHINPQTGDPYSSNDAPYVGLYRLKDYSLDNLFGTSFAPCTGQLCPLNVILSLNQFNLDPVTQGIETNNACADEYKVAFNAPQMASSADPYSVINQGLADLFDFAVNGEIGTVSHSYIMSPAVPKETYRIVVKWTPDENSTQFQGGFYSESFNDSDSKSHIKTAVDLKKYECTKSSVIGGGKNNSGYWWPDTADGKCKSSVGIYTHPIQQLGGIAIQSFTVDAKDFPLGSKIGFFVQSLADPIGLYTTKDIQVEVYNYHPNQNPTFSVYKPSYTFNISSAAQSFVNKSAKYWYVFNISVGGYISSGFANPINPNSSIQTIKQSVIKPVQTIETNTDQLVLEYFTGTN